MSLYEGTHKPNEPKNLLPLFILCLAVVLLVVLVGLGRAEECKRTITGQANPMNLCDNTCTSDGKMISTSKPPHDCKYYLEENRLNAVEQRVEDLELIGYQEVEDCERSSTEEKIYNENGDYIGVIKKSSCEN